MSALGQKRTLVTSLNHLVGGCEQGRRDCDAERLGSLEVHNHLVFGRRLNRKVGRLLALKDAINIGGRAAVLIGLISSVRDEAPSSDK